MYAIFMALEGLFDLIGEFIFDKAFDKKKTLKLRLPYIIIYVLTLTIIITFLILGGIYLLQDSNLIGIILYIRNLRFFNEQNRINALTNISSIMYT